MSRKIEIGNSWYSGVLRNTFLFRFEPKPTETSSCFGNVSVCFVKLWNFLFRILNRNKMEPKQTQTGQNEDQQRNKGTTQEKKKKVEEQWVELCYYSCIASKVVSFGSTKTLKLAVSQFQETSETSLFVSDSVKLVSVLFIWNELRRTPTHVSEFVSSQLFRI